VEEYAALCSSHGYEVISHALDIPGSSRRTNVFTVPKDTAIALELTNLDGTRKKGSLEKLDSSLPAECAILSTSMVITATEQATWIKKKHRLIGIAALPGFSAASIAEIAPTIYTPVESIEVARRFYLSIGKEIEVVQDRIGMVLPRIVCQLVNEAAFALQEDIATPEMIDLAVKLGLNYPYGPIEWADRIGVRQVHSVLSALENDLNEPRYRISPVLRQMALTGEWWGRVGSRSSPKKVKSMGENV
jgi:3-hydroxybutyryl-CoA dehydrogenase